MPEQIKWQRNSAALKIVTSVPIAKPEMSLGSVLSGFQKKIKEYELISYIYVTDDSNRLVGVFSVKRLFHLPKTEKVKAIMIKDPIAVHMHTHPERIALLAINHGISAIPVIDKDKKLLGIVSSGAILSILHNENIEDVLRSAGIHKFANPAQELVTATTFSYFRKRLPWLIIGLIGSILAAFIVGFFEAALMQQILLAAFIPMVVYISDAVGTQTETIFIRSLAVSQNFDFKKYLLREIAVVIMLAVVLGVLGFVFSFFIYHSFSLSEVVGISIFLAAIMAAAVAILLPWIFYKLNFDPAIPSGPFATVLSDIISVFVYFAIATTVMHWV